MYNRAKFKGQAFTEYAMFLERYATLSGTSFLIALMNILFSLFFFFATIVHEWKGKCLSNWAQLFVELEGRQRSALICCI